MCCTARGIESKFRGAECGMLDVECNMRVRRDRDEALLLLQGMGCSSFEREMERERERGEIDRESLEDGVAQVII